MTGAVHHPLGARRRPAGLDADELRAAPQGRGGAGVITARRRRSAAAAADRSGGRRRGRAGA
jgi:hypothetical protein